MHKAINANSTGGRVGARPPVERQSSHNPNNPKKQRPEFSKQIMIFMTVFTVLITLYTLILMWRTSDTSPLAYLIPAVFAEYATATGFYYWKARKENEIKLRRLYGEAAEKTFNNQNNYYENGGI